MTSTKMSLLSPKLGKQERDFVFAVAMKFVRDEFEADDVAQDTLLLAHRHRRSFGGHSRYSTWLYRVATTAALTHLRSKKRNSRELLHSQLGSNESSQIERLESTGPTPEETIRDREKLNSILRSIKELGPKYAEVLELRWFSEYSEQELSQQLQLPITTIKTRSFRGRQQILSSHQLAA